MYVELSVCTLSNLGRAHPQQCIYSRLRGMQHTHMHRHNTQSYREKHNDVVTKAWNKNVRESRDYVIMHVQLMMKQTFLYSLCLANCNFIKLMYQSGTTSLWKPTMKHAGPRTDGKTERLLVAVSTKKCNSWRHHQQNTVHYMLHELVVIHTSPLPHWTFPTIMRISWAPLSRRWNKRQLMHDKPMSGINIRLQTCVCMEENCIMITA